MPRFTFLGATITTLCGRVKAQALDQLGRAQVAQAVLLDSLGWARYGFEPDDDERAWMSDSAAFLPLGHVG